MQRSRRDDDGLVEVEDRGAAFGTQLIVDNGVRAPGHVRRR
ncbi:hypothetical protein ACFC3F_11800 [Microbacterium sp. NPDC055910]